MTKTHFYKKGIILMALTMVAALSMVGCQKEDDIRPIINDTTPEEPQQANYFAFGNDTLEIVSILKMHNSDGYEYLFTLSNEDQFMVMGAGEPNAGPDQFASVEDYFVNNIGTLGFYSSLTAQEFLQSGTFEVKCQGNIYDIRILGTTESTGKTIDAHYQGTLTDLNAPNGNGSLTLDGNNFELNYFMHAFNGEVHQYLLRDITGQSSTMVIVQSLTELHNGSYTLGDNPEQLADGTVLAMQISLDENGNDFLVSHGTLQYSNENGRYALLFNGQTAAGIFNGSYEGGIFDYSNMAKKINTLRNNF